METQVFYYLYRTTNLMNGKIYVGKHKTTNLNDGYIGSGKILKRAIAKYGRENFTCEVIEWHQSEHDLNLAEQNLVTEEFCLRDDNYNLCVGGLGGFSYINRLGLGGTLGRKFTEEHKSKQRLAALAVRKRWTEEQTTEYKMKAKLGRRLGKRSPGVGQHTEETKQKMSRQRKGSGTGCQNSQFGTVWITNGTSNIKIHKDVDVPVDWYYGRTLKNKYTDGLMPELVTGRSAKP